MAKNDRRPSVAATKPKSPLTPVRAPVVKVVTKTTRKAKAPGWTPIKAAAPAKSREATPGWFASSARKPKVTRAVKPPKPTKPVVTPPITPPVVNPPVTPPTGSRSVNFRSGLPTSAKTAFGQTGAHKFGSYKPYDAFAGKIPKLPPPPNRFKGYNAYRGKPISVKSLVRAGTVLVQAGQPLRAPSPNRVRQDPVRAKPDQQDRDCVKSKDRPKENTPKKGGGSGKKFVPWSGTKYGC